MRDAITDISGVVALVPQTETADAVGEVIDLRGCDGLGILLSVGAGTIDAATNFLTLGFDEADADAAGNPVNWTALSDLKITGDRKAVAPNKVYKIGCLSIKRFVRLTLKESGSVSVAISAMGVARFLQAEGKGWA